VVAGGQPGLTGADHHDVDLVRPLHARHNTDPTPLCSPARVAGGPGSGTLGRVWTPDHFAATDPSWDAQLITEHPFGLLVSCASGVPVATHLPMLIHPEDRDRADAGLAGVRVLGHLARLNPQWRRITDGDPVLLIFTGPHGYVSPTQYADQPAAPTWNYTAVHLTGPIRLLHDEPDLLRVIDATIDTTERGRDPEWDREPSRDYIAKIISGVVAFEVTVEHVASSFKLSQDQPEHRRAAVTEQALGSPDESRRRLGDWMRRAARHRDP